jgi:hypothetical protein
MSHATYFRRQADICPRLSLISSDEEVSNRLIVMAQEYKARADVTEAESKSLPAAMVTSLSRVETRDHSHNSGSRRLARP